MANIEFSSQQLGHDPIKIDQSEPNSVNKAKYLGVAIDLRKIGVDPELFIEAPEIIIRTLWLGRLIDDLSLFKDRLTND